MIDHPIQGLMKTAMEAIKDMVDVNTIVGDAVETPDGNVIVPISRVSFGFAAGGSEFEPGGGPAKRAGTGQNGPAGLAFGGGSGAGVSIHPVGFLIVGQGTVRLLPVDGRAVIDRLIDLAPLLLDKIGTAAGSVAQRTMANPPAPSARRAVYRRPPPAPPVSAGQAR
ncbi:MAG TPA: GerW family sporulation protein [Bacillota bacterium]|nr:GerW family sporulation protein [Bacillota bacterium]